MALRSENDVLRARLGETASSPVPFELEDAKLPRAVTVSAAITEAEEEEEPMPVPHTGGSVVPLPTRTRQVAAESPERSAAVVAEATRDLRRMAVESKTDGKDARPRMPAAAVPGAANIGELVALRMVSNTDAPAESKTTQPSAEEPTDNPERRFFAALAEIRALKRAANQAGE